MRDPHCVHFYLRLRDAFADHGVVSVMIALRLGDVLDIDTWLMSCRVVGRTVEATMLEHLCQRAQQLGCTAIRGTYLPTPKNEMVKDLFSQFGFERLDDSDGASRWLYDLRTKGTITNEFITMIRA
jgi:FkbH-like protein